MGPLVQVSCAHPRGLSTAALRLLQLVRENTDPTGRSGDATSGERKVSLPCWSRVFQLSCFAFPPGQPTGAHHTFLTSRGLACFPREGEAEAIHASSSLFSIKQWQPVASLPPAPFLRVWPQAVEDAGSPLGALAAPVWCEGTPGSISSSWGGPVSGRLHPVFPGPP